MAMLMRLEEKIKTLEILLENVIMNNNKNDVGNDYIGNIDIICRLQNTILCLRKRLFLINNNDILRGENE